jgi:hypothetical protein
VLITGSGQGIEMISRMFVEPGDTVILEVLLRRCDHTIQARWRRHHRHSAR